MRLPIAALCGLFLTATIAGCGGASTPSPPENAKPGPPPGPLDDMVKQEPKAKK